MKDYGKKTVVDCSKDKILVKQSFTNEADINNIMARYVKTGMLTHEALNSRQLIFADVSEIGDFQTCQERIKAAQAAFMTLPPDLRARFENDPAQLLDFCSKDENRDEAIELGIIPKPTKVSKETLERARVLPIEPVKETAKELAEEIALKAKEAIPKA